MRDWQAFVKSELHLAGIRPGREARLVGEVAAQLEDLCRDALLRGATDEEADRLARQHVTDWTLLAAELTGVDRTCKVPPIERRTNAAVERRSSLCWLWQGLSTLQQDLRHAARVLVRRPGVSAVLVLTLALGIGANSAIFGAVDAILLRSLPYQQADRLVNLFEHNRARGISREDVSVHDYVDWQREARVFDGAAAYLYQSGTLTGVAEARRLVMACISVDAFHLLGVVPAVGRDFVVDDARSGEAVVILSHRLWQQHFAGDPGVAGRTIGLDGRPHLVVGVMPASFRFLSQDIDLWRPMTSDLSLLGGRNRHFAHAIARLKPGVTVEQARRDMDRVAAILAGAYPATNAGWGVGVESLQESMVGESRALLLIAWAAAGLVLLIACSNAAGILVTEAAAREREIAVRTALGAARCRIAAQMLTEALLVAAISGGLGVGLAAVGVRALSALVVGTVPLAERMALDWRVVVFTMITVAVVAVVAGLVPTLRATTVTSAIALKEAGRTTQPGRRRSFRHVFVAGQVALALVLLVAAGLIGRSVVNLWHTNTGFDPRGVVTFAYQLPADANSTAESIAAVHEQVALRLGQVPGVESVGQSLVLPFEGELESHSFGIEGRLASETAHAPVMVRQVSTNFLSALRVPLLRGRQFTTFDRATGERVAIISRATAARHWPTGNPLGSRLRIMKLSWTIVGVAEDVPAESLDAVPKPVVYVPLVQWPDPLPGIGAVVRTRGDATASIGALRAAMATVNKDVPIYGVRTLEQMSSDSIARQRFGALILMVFAGVALVLAVVGIYGTVSNLVAQRTHEIGIRMAVGAGPGDILRATVGEGVLLAAGGILVGAGCAAATARLLGSLLFGVSSTDAVTYLVMSGLLLLVVMMASWVPGRRATRIDPVSALRSE